MLNALFWRVAGLSLACSAVLLPLLLAVRPLCRRYSARTCYALWLLLALRLILPIPAAQTRRAVTVEVPRYEIELTAPAHKGAESAPAKPQPPVYAGNTAAAEPEAVPAAPAASTVSLTSLLPGLWLAGAAVCGLWLALSCAFARRGLLKAARPAGPEDEALLEALCRELGCKRRPALYRSDRVGTPMLLGLARPVVALPAGAPEGEELSVMLRHELTHLRRHDVAYKLLFGLACAVHWFNPLVWRMAREAGRCVELCCDEDVVRGRDRAFRRAYGEILLKTAAGAGRAPALSARMGGGKGYLKVRLSNLFAKKKNSAALVCAVLAAAMLGGSLVSCTGEGAEAAKQPQADQTPAAAGSPAPSEDLEKQLEKWNAVLAGYGSFPPEGMDPQVWASNRDQAEQKIKGIRESIREMTENAPTHVDVQIGASQEELDRLAVQELLDSVSVSSLGAVSFTLPQSNREAEDWQIEFRGREEFEGLGGASIHIPFSDAGLKAGVRYTYDFYNEWSNITDLFLLVKLGGEGQDIDLRALAQARDGESGIVPEERLADTGLTNECWYYRDKGGFGGDFSIYLAADGHFSYCAGLLSSYIGLGRWTWDGETLCLEDEGLKDSKGIQRFYFTLDGGDLIFQAERSDEFMYVDVADGERFSMDYDKSTLYLGKNEPATE